MMTDLLIVQPMFTAVGHPAQSLVNTARVLGRRHDTRYLISCGQRQQELAPLVAQLESLGPVWQFKVPANSSLALGTLLSMWTVVSIARRHPSQFSLFFLDAHLPVLALLWPLVRGMLPNLRRISVLALSGPENWARRWWIRRLLSTFLLSPKVCLFLRTEELATSWRAEYPIRAMPIDTLPSLEIPDEDDAAPPAVPSVQLRFGVIGQVRPGKGIEWLVPLFTEHPGIGELEVVGTYYDDHGRKRLPMLEGSRYFRNHFIAPGELVRLAGSFDYVLTLYDKWDPRLEAATFYLAARAQRPVICYDAGWCGRMIRQFGCGVAVDPSRKLPASFFCSLPGRDSSAYKAMTEGMNHFRVEHSGSVRRAEFLRKIIGQRTDA